jgi:hypothetical protein
LPAASGKSVLDKSDSNSLLQAGGIALPDLGVLPGWSTPLSPVVGFPVSAIRGPQL